MNDNGLADELLEIARTFRQGLWDANEILTKGLRDWFDSHGRDGVAPSELVDSLIKERNKHADAATVKLRNSIKPLTEKIGL